MEFGLTEKQRGILTACLENHIKQGIVVVYGSRAKGNFTPRSDIDLVIKSADATDQSLLANIEFEIDESNFPYLCDIQYLEKINNQALLEHIERVGKAFYQKGCV